ncbi:NAD(P)-dependent oxidoreductase [Nonomuraea aurantiaca]|uniref:NAD(P)-dependent oxidoreductase n=1 Tax=Nonomuraea aurantiaca TaxID=2878562 RepID=UPI001CDA308D|nr:NAD(P)-dependent oxidoreductase [Nonomuraea aurantiaca]MCA2222459.1 NAD(P)-dependent oxidoreductase [Nonomuraea aurantiaca]
MLDSRLPKIGFIGVGRMGLPMCANLARAGHRVHASDVRPEREKDVVAAGALWAASAAEAAAGAEVLVTMLPGPEEVRAVMLAPGDALEALAAGATWIDMTSNSPALVAPIREQAERRGVRVLEAPVGGGVPAARAGTLHLFVGGPADLLARHRPLLDVLGDPERIIHLGGPGTGYTAKLLANLLWFGQAIATAEALLLGRRAGIDLAVLREALGSSAASSTFVRRDLDALFAGDYLESFGLDRCCEELETVTAMADELGVPFELSHLVERTYQRALDRYGAVDGELLAIALLEEQAGLRLRP